MGVAVCTVTDMGLMTENGVLTYGVAVCLTNFLGAVRVENLNVLFLQNVSSRYRLRKVSKSGDVFIIFWILLVIRM